MKKLNSPIKKNSYNPPIFNMGSRLPGKTNDDKLLEELKRKLEEQKKKKKKK